jgi:hypothetical protein
MHKQVVVVIQDLRFAVILCRHCNTKVTLDLAAEIQQRFVVPRECPRCQDQFDSAIPGAIEALQRVYKSLAEVGSAVSFTSDAEPQEAEKP